MKVFTYPIVPLPKMDAEAFTAYRESRPHDI